LALIAVATLGWSTALQAQEVRPLAPVLEPDESEQPGKRDADGKPQLIPLPDVSSRTATASRDRVQLVAVLPASWTHIAERYQPVWVGIATPHGFGLHAWGEYFALSAAAPTLSAHPFFSPWGILSYDGWVYDRYRDVWSRTQTSELLADASIWMQRGDRMMAEARPAEAVQAYRRVTQSAPDFPIGYIGLGAALAELGEDEDAARAFRQGFERYPGWLGLSFDWTRLYGDSERLRSVLAAAARRTGGDRPSPSRFVAGVLHLFGGRPEQGRALLRGMGEGDVQAQRLLSQSL
jgi:tetratricopeptide (TPR) repeat protein